MRPAPATGSRDARPPAAHRAPLILALRQAVPQKSREEVDANGVPVRWRREIQYDFVPDKQLINVVNGIVRGAHQIVLEVSDCINETLQKCCPGFCFSCWD